MEEVSKQQEEVIFDRLHETAYQGTGLGRTILGPVQNIQSITRDDLTSFVKNNYTGPRVVIAGAGAVEHQQVRASFPAAIGSLSFVLCFAVGGFGREALWQAP